MPINIDRIVDNIENADQSLRLAIRANASEWSHNTDRAIEVARTSLRNILKELIKANNEDETKEVSSP